MPLTDFEVQKRLPNDYKDLAEWRDVSVSTEVDLRNSQIDELQAASVELTADRDKCKARADELYSVVLKADDVLKNSASIEDARSVLEPFIVEAKTPEDEKRIAELQQQLADLNAKEAEIQAEIDKINGQ